MISKLIPLGILFWGTTIMANDTRLESPKARAAIEKIYALGGRVDYIEDQNKVHVALIGNAFGDKELELLVPLGKFESVAVGKSKITEAGLVQLQQYPWLEHLNLAETNMGDEQLKHLLVFKQMTSLCLAKTAVTGKTLGMLSQLPKLNSLYLGGSPLGNEADAQLAKLTQLKYLSMSGSLNIPDSLIKQIAQLPNLESLDLSKAQITDDALSSLVSSPKLKWLSIARTPVTSDGVRVLTRSKTLEYLDLERTSVDYEIVPAFSKMESLKKLNLCETKISDQDVLVLQIALPHLTVLHKSTVDDGPTVRIIPLRLPTEPEKEK